MDEETSKKTSVDEIRTFSLYPFANVVGIMLGGVLVDIFTI